jgi:hypothetical protein
VCSKPSRVQHIIIICSGSPRPSKQSEQRSHHNGDAGCSAWAAAGFAFRVLER